MDAYTHEIYHGKPLDHATVTAIKIAEGKLGYELTIFQGIGGAAASAGTHIEGRAVDFSTWDKARKLKVLKDVGFAIWFRPTIRGLWSEHLHGVLILNEVDNHRGIAESAWRQIISYLNRRDGLRSNRSDNSYRPNPRAIFKYPPKEKPVPVNKKPLDDAKDMLVKAAHYLGQAAVELDKTHRPSKAGQARMKAQAAAIRVARRTVNGIHRALPKS